MRPLAPRAPAVLLAAALFAGAPSAAHGTVRPPADSLAVELKWLARTGPVWTARLRLLGYVTTGHTPGSPFYTSLALRLPDSLAILGADSALVVLSGTQLPAPGYPSLPVSAAAATAFRNKPSAPPGGVWRGAFSPTPATIVPPNQPVEVCWFVRTPAGISTADVMSAVRRATFGSATGDVSANPVADFAFKSVTNVRIAGGGGGSSRPKTIDP